MVVYVYNYDPVTFEYYSSEPAGRNPLNAEEPLIPACSTTVKPPEPQEGYAVVWIGNKWQYKEDHRGEAWYNVKTGEIEEIDFIGKLPSYYYTPDSPVANKPEGDYWQFDVDTQSWVGNAGLYKLHILNIFPTYWEQKLDTPFEFKGNRYLPSWRELYTSIWVALSEDLKSEYRLQDYDGKFVNVNKETMKPIIGKISDVNDEMYTDKHDLEVYFKIENNFDKLQEVFEKWIKKTY